MNTVVTTDDNLIVLNNGEVGAGVTCTYDTNKQLLGSGFEIDRGSLPNYQFVFDETDEVFKLGQKDTQLQTVATRNNSMEDNGIVVWNGTTSTLSTTKGCVVVESIVSKSISTDRININKINTSSLTIGSNNVCTGVDSAILGGKNHTLFASDAIIVGGKNNKINIHAVGSAIIGGHSNTVTGSYSLATGQSDVVVGSHSVAMGERVITRGNNSFVWGDGSITTVNSDAREFVTRATGGFKIFTTTGNVGLKINSGGNKWTQYNGSLMESNAVQLNKIPISTITPVAGQILQFNGTEYIPVNCCACLSKNKSIP